MNDRRFGEKRYVTITECQSSLSPWQKKTVGAGWTVIDIGGDFMPMAVETVSWGRKEERPRSAGMDASVTVIQ